VTGGNIQSTEASTMRDVRKIGRHTWLARASGGALAVWTSLRIGGKDGWAISLRKPAAPIAHAQEPADIRRIPLGQGGFTTSYAVVRGSEAAIVDTGVAGAALGRLAMALPNDAAMLERLLSGEAEQGCCHG
jgi:hypothetical protein